MKQGLGDHSKDSDFIQSTGKPYRVLSRGSPYSDLYF